MLAFVGLLVFAAGCVTGATGLGFVMLSIVALSVVMEAQAAIIVLSLTGPVTACAQLVRHWSERGQFRRLLPIFAGAVAGVPLGTALLLLLPGPTLYLLLGSYMIMYAASGLVRLRFFVRPDREKWLSPLAGLTAGIVQGATGGAGAVLASYLLALDLGAKTFAFFLSCLFLIISFAQVISLATAAQYSQGIILLGLLVGVVGLLGQRLGFWIQDRLDRASFQRAVLVVLLAAGATFVGRGAGL